MQNLVFLCNALLFLSCRISAYIVLPLPNLAPLNFRPTKNFYQRNSAVPTFRALKASLHKMSEDSDFKDPLSSVRSSCAESCAEAQFVSINDEALSKLAESMISKDQAAVSWDFDTHYHDGGDLTVQVCSQSNSKLVALHPKFL